MKTGIGQILMENLNWEVLYIEINAKETFSSEKRSITADKDISKDTFECGSRYSIFHEWVAIEDSK